MFCAYATAASITVSPGVMSVSRSSSSRQSRRTSGSHGSICFGANAGSSSRRAIPWNGGSLVIGGAPPIGAGIARSPGRPTDTTTERLVKLLGVVRDRVDGSCVKRHPHAAVAVGVSNGAPALAELLPHLRSDGVVRGVGVVEVGREVGDRAVVVGVVRHPQPDVCALGPVTDDRHVVLARCARWGGGDFGRIDVVGHVCTTP